MCTTRLASLWFVLLVGCGSRVYIPPTGDFSHPTDGGGGNDSGPSCSDGTQNGDESDTDCGGSCGKCDIGKNCRGASDCQSSICNGGICMAPAGCNDGIQNQSESDIDCGGSCSRCVDGKRCNG